MKIVITIETNREGDTGVFVSRLSEPSTVTEATYARCLEEVIGRMLKSAGDAMVEKGLAHAVSVSGENPTALLHRQFKGGELPPRNLSGN